MTIVIRDNEWKWVKITSGVRMGSVLSLMMFLIYLNPMVEGVDSYTNLLTDGAKVIRRVENELP